MALLHTRVKVHRRRWVTPSVELRRLRAPAAPPVMRLDVAAPPARAGSNDPAIARAARVVRRVAVRSAPPTVGARVFGFGAPLRRPAALVPMPAIVREADLPLRAFDPPTALRRLFARPEGPRFLSPDTPEARVLDVMRARSLRTAAEMADTLQAGPALSDDQRAFVTAACRRALCADPSPEAWGEDGAMDGVRLRLLRAAVEHPIGFPILDWTHFLCWAGDQLAPSSIADLPRELLWPALTALACVQGERTALEVLLRHTPAPWNDAAVRAPAAVLALRCALDGVFLPPMIQMLLPRGREPRTAIGRAQRFLPALFAWEAYRESGPVAGFVHFTAALVSADLRARLRALLGGEFAALAQQATRLTPGAFALLPRVVSVLRSGTPLYFPSRPGPWQAMGGGPDGEGVISLVAGIMPQRWMAAEVFLDARLAAAAVHALLGFTPSARAQAEGARVPPVLEETRVSLLRALDAPRRRTVEVKDLPALPLGPDARRVFDRLRSTPEPNLALGSPWWLLEDRGAVITRLVREGRRPVASAIRSLLDRRDVRQDVEPFWLLSERDTEAMRGLALRLAERADCAVTERQALTLLERWCRQRDAGDL